MVESLLTESWKYPSMSIYKTPDTPTKTGKREGSQNYPTIVNTRLYLLRIEPQDSYLTFLTPPTQFQASWSQVRPHMILEHTYREQAWSHKTTSHRKVEKGVSFGKEKVPFCPVKTAKPTELSGREGAWSRGSFPVTIPGFAAPCRESLYRKG